MSAITLVRNSNYFRVRGSPRELSFPFWNITALHEPVANGGAHARNVCRAKKRCTQNPDGGQVHPTASRRRFQKHKCRWESMRRAGKGTVPGSLLYQFGKSRPRRRSSSIVGAPNSVHPHQPTRRTWLLSSPNRCAPPDETKCVPFPSPFPAATRMSFEEMRSNRLTAASRQEFPATENPASEEGPTKKRPRRGANKGGQRRGANKGGQRRGRGANKGGQRRGANKKGAHEERPTKKSPAKVQPKKADRGQVHPTARSSCYIRANVHRNRCGTWPKVPCPRLPVPFREAAILPGDASARRTKCVPSPAPPYRQFW